MKPSQSKWTSMAAGLWGGKTSAVDWPRLGQAALERDLLGPVDLKLVETLAVRAGRPQDGAFRVVIGCLLAAVRSGGLRIPAEPRPLAARLEDFLRGLHAGSATLPPEARDQGFAAASDPDLAEIARTLAASFSNACLAGAYAAVLGGPDDFKPVLLSGQCLYFQKYRAAEAVAGTRLAALLSAPDRQVRDADAESALDDVLRRFPLRLGRGTDAPAMEFSEGQKAALSLGLRKRLLVVSGGPGTGKTSLVANLLRALVRLPAVGVGVGADAGAAAPAGNPPRPLRIRLSAPTGRAAQRLTESLRSSLGSISYAGGPEAGNSVEAEAAMDAGLAGLAGETLHRLLRYQPVRGEYYHRKGRPIPADVVIVDEASMIDIFALARLLDALEEGAALILLGDMDQLPSVEAGAVLADLVPAAGPGPGDRDSPLRDRLVLLDRSHRSGLGILEVTREINAQRGEAALAAMAPPFHFHSDGGPGPWPVAFLEAAGEARGRKRVPGGGCRLILPAMPGPAGDAAAPAFGPGLPSLLEAWATFHYLDNPLDPARHPGSALASPRRAAYADLIGRLSGAPMPDPEVLAGVAASPWADDMDEAFACIDQARILTFTRKGWYGSLAVNRRLREKLAPAWDPMGGLSGSEGFNGSPVMIQENDYAQDLFNGEVGIMLRIRGRYMAFFRKEEGYRPYPAPMLPRHELAFASTVHKAQGSEYDQVLLILPEAGNRLLFKETLYTAITRARHFAGIYGPREVFLEAVGRKVERESGLREFLTSVPAT